MYRNDGDDDDDDDDDIPGGDSECTNVTWNSHKLHYAFNSNHCHWGKACTTEWLPFEHICAGIDCKLIWQ